jgi:hypothetical protein
MLVFVIFLMMLLPAAWFTDFLEFIIHLFTFPHFPLWLNATIALSVLSWFMSD